jgi:hypothetical protein
MSGYDNPYPVTYVYPALAFGGASSASTIKPPKRSAGSGTMKNGIIHDIHVAVTVLFTAVTTPAFVRLGYSADHDYYAELNMGAAAASAGINAGEQSTYPIFRAIDLANDPTPGALTAVLLNFVAATGGSPAGTGTTMINIGWY